MPAPAGIHFALAARPNEAWIPACAGMTTPKSRLPVDKFRTPRIKAKGCSVPTKPYPTVEGFKTVFAELAEKVPAARTANPKDFVDTRFLEEFDRSGFIDGLYN